MTPPEAIIQEIQNLYRSDSIPWIVGYSGGKDSTASLQLIWKAVAGLPAEQRTKEIHVISTDTLVENPVIAAWVASSLATMEEEAVRQNLPIKPHRLMPTVENRFWVNLIGKGYPAPRHRFRWCTDRLKISASTQFIQDLSEKHSEAILVLGQRRGESATRDKVMDNYSGSTRERLSRNKDPKLSRVWVYLPIETWSSDDVWMYVLTEPNPWGVDNQDLFSIYKGATPDAECPVVVDKSTPSCGDSRFGCYVCTMVSQDKSMAAMIQNDEQKAWMQPILAFRDNYLSINDWELRDFQRMNGRTKLMGKENPELIHGPYLQQHRAKLLEELLRTQKIIRSAKVPGHDQIELISLDELDAIRHIWVEEKGEIEDLVPEIYKNVFDTPYPGKPIEPHPLEKEDLALLQEVTAELDPEAGERLYRLARNLLAVQFQSMQTQKRSKHLDRLDEVLKANAFRTEAEALAFAISNQESNIQNDPSTDEELELIPLVAVEAEEV
ncbi:DNA phosphorothioation system sulfurtransferase DndC [Pseudomonas luteola]|uniref:DNA phosphorothioation system sulfurtransferase DndC n=1 Tax=Pseudomonas luteola TaxID=47886 RepID=UPI00123B51ED|nr:MULTISPECIES: DNA phosphorothioation system sulfurtransferase DndC [Pseudomonas]MBA1249943.1 DNA phosphorothioation system sulfurtransferase DndC [Pseudomonas zeshuii]QEU28762.1 DNA phosphorothioation system sulfurtransferase DndC [Pseudomonas luteola]